ncbi:flippase-like domain-containing protein [Aeromicrobium sp.]|nr:flippase-like domain-containing protein [Candidatus Saccharibacteria bacterium]
MELLRSAKKLWSKPAVKKSVVVGILVLTFVAFGRFFMQHPEYLRQLGHTSPWTILWVLLLNGAMIVVLVAATEATLRLCGKSLGLRENFNLTSYASIANFFGPLQSGPGVKAAYLKARHGVRLRDFTLASLVLLSFFALFSALFLFIGTRPWWQTVGALLVAGGCSVLAIRFFMQRDKTPADSQLHFQPAIVGTLAGLAFLQVVIASAWYYVELQAVDPAIQFSQAISYAGAANFSLFVSITPDGVGIRETFLLFSQGIHHVPTRDIVAANVIDRAVYVVFLIGLLAVVSLTHVSSKLKLADLKRSTAKSSSKP